MWTLRQKDKELLTSIGRTVFRTAGCPLFDPKKNEGIFGRVESTAGRRETKKIQFKFTTTSNKNEQQWDGKNNAEL